MDIRYTLQSEFSGTQYIAGPFNLSGTTSGNTTYLLASGITKSQLLSGFTVTTPYNITGGTIQSLGTCSNTPPEAYTLQFIIGNGFNQFVYVNEIQSDNKIITGGAFTAFSGVVRNQLARLNSNGSLDTTFIVGSGFGGTTPNTIKIQTDNKILIGGSFTSYSGVSANKIVRLNTDGSRDNTFNIGLGFGTLFSDSVQTINQQSDTKIIVAGNFTTYMGVSANKIVRLNTDGSRDSTFVVGSGFGTNSNETVWDSKIQSDGKIIAVGRFTSYNGTSRNSIVRINTNGSIDLTFVVGSGFYHPTLTEANTILIQLDGKILVGGNFTSYNGVSTNYMVRLNTNGSLDTTFNPAVNAAVNEIKSQLDGKLLIIGGTAGGTINLKRLNSDGSLDLTFNISTINGGLETVNTQSDGKIISSGYFTVYNGVTQNYITRLNTDGSLNV